MRIAMKITHAASHNPPIPSQESEVATTKKTKKMVDRRYCILPFNDLGNVSDMASRFGNQEREATVSSILKHFVD
jgi:hypothetical protein